LGVLERRDGELADPGAAVDALGQKTGLELKLGLGHTLARRFALGRQAGIIRIGAGDRLPARGGAGDVDPKGAQAPELVHLVEADAARPKDLDRALVCQLVELTDLAQ